MGKISGLLNKAFVEQEPQQSGYRELGRIIDVRTSEITPNPGQPRKHFPTEELTALAKSISQNGVIQPLTVRKTREGFELISGERRLRASKLAGLLTVPCIVVKADEKRSAVMALIENIQRSDLDCFEEARAISRLIEEEGLSREEVSVRLSMAQSTLANKLRILKLSEEEQRIITRSGLTERHARALLKLTEEPLRREVLLKAAQGNWTVGMLEEYIRRLEREQVRRESYSKRAPMLKDVRLFFNSVNKAVEVMRLAGVEATTKRIEKEECIQYIITIPNQKE